VKTFVTGANGFVGRALIEKLLSESYEVKALVRQQSEALPLVVEQVIMGDLADLSLSGTSQISRRHFKDVDVVVHTAARVHVMDDTSNNMIEYRKVNRDATMVLARLAAKAGVKRFIFLSSIKVNGELTVKSQPFTPDDIHVPDDPYGLSKYEAEQGLLTLAQETKMDVVIIRPPLVYGPGVKGNFASMIKWMNKPLPLPFGAIHNQRSLIALDNLVSFISLCVDLKKSTKASNQVFLICDGEDVSTTQLLKKVRQALSFQSPRTPKAWLLPVPASIVTFFIKLLGKKDIAVRLSGSLQVDSSKAHDLLKWTPVVDLDEQLAKIPKEILK
jgi:nucleoside-diphosphate-sugar epimerase